MKLKEIGEVDPDRELLLVIEGDDGMEGYIWLKYTKIAAMASRFGYRLVSDMEN